MEEEEFELIYSQSPIITEFEVVPTESIRNIDDEKIYIHDDHFVPKKDLMVPSDRSNMEVLQSSPQINEKKPLYSEILKNALKNKLCDGNVDDQEQEKNCSSEDLIGETMVFHRNKTIETSDSDDDASLKATDEQWAINNDGSATQVADRSLLPHSNNDYGLNAFFENKWVNEGNEKSIRIKTMALVFTVSLSIVLGGCLGNCLVSLLIPMGSNPPVDNAVFQDVITRQRELDIILAKLYSNSVMVNFPSIPYNAMKTENLNIILHAYRRLQAEHNYLKQAFDELSDSIKIERQMKWHWKKAAGKDNDMPYLVKYAFYDGLMKVQQSMNFEKNNEKGEQAIQYSSSNVETSAHNFYNKRKVPTPLRQGNTARNASLLKGLSLLSPINQFSSPTKYLAKSMSYARRNAYRSTANVGNQGNNAWRKMKRQGPMNEITKASFNRRLNGNYQMKSIPARNYGSDNSDQSLSSLSHRKPSESLKDESAVKAHSREEGPCMFEKKDNMQMQRKNENSFIVDMNYNIENINAPVNLEIQNLYSKKIDGLLFPVKGIQNATANLVSLPHQLPNSSLHHKNRCSDSKQEEMGCQKCTQEVKLLAQKFNELQFLSAVYKWRERRHEAVMSENNKVLLALKEEKEREFEGLNEKYKVMREELVALKVKMWKEMNSWYMEKEKDKYYIDVLNGIIRFNGKIMRKWKAAVKEQSEAALQKLANTIRNEERLKTKRKFNEAKHFLRTFIEKEVILMEKNRKFHTRNEKMKKKLKKKVYYYKSVYEQSINERSELRELFQKINEDLNRKEREAHQLREQLNTCTKDLRENEILKVIKSETRTYSDIEGFRDKKLRYPKENVNEETHLSVRFPENMHQNKAIFKRNAQVKMASTVYDITERRSGKFPFTMKPSSHKDIYPGEIQNEEASMEEKGSSPFVMPNLDLNEFISNFVGVIPRSTYASTRVPPHSLYLVNPYMTSYETQMEYRYLMDKELSIRNNKTPDEDKGDGRLHTSDSILQPTDNMSSHKSVDLEITVLAPCNGNIKSSLKNEKIVQNEEITMSLPSIIRNSTLFDPLVEDLKNNVLKETFVRSDSNNSPQLFYPKRDGVSTQTKVVIDNNSKHSQQEQPAEIGPCSQVKENDSLHLQSVVKDDDSAISDSNLQHAEEDEPVYVSREDEYMDIYGPTLPKTNGFRSISRKKRSNIMKSIKEAFKLTANEERAEEDARKHQPAVPRPPKRIARIFS